MTIPSQCDRTAVTVFSGPDGLYPLGTPLIRVAGAAEPDTVAAAISDQIGQTGSVFLELPDGRLTMVVTVDGDTWNPQGRQVGADDGQ
jgi:hypothetical protein